MNITNFSEFYNMINRCNLQKTAPFSTFISVVDDYKLHCNCTNPSEKNVKRFKCVDLYVKLVNNNIPNYIPTIKSLLKFGKIIFSNNGKIIKVY